MSQVNRDMTYFVADTPDVSLADFLSRPILLYTALWEIGVPLTYVFNAFDSFLDDTRVKEKTKGYAWVTGTINLKITTTGTPYHYGKLAMCYEPLPRDDILPTIRQCLQLPHVCVDPGNEEGGILKMPLIHPWNALAVVNVGDLPTEAQPDVTRIRTINTLRATGGVTAPLEVQVWAWMTDVHLSCPTVVRDIVEQSGRVEGEYKNTNVSALATAAGKSLGHWRDFPYIGKYALASQMALEGLGKIAAMFGYSRVSSFPESRATIPYQIGNLSNCNVVDTSVKLALDCKAEVTVDPRVVGLPPKDEMTLVSMCSREWLVGIYQVQVGIIGAPIAAIAVSPAATIDRLLEGAFEMSPSAFASAPFEHWRGTMYYRIEVVASAFHRGKLRIQYDPRNTIIAYPNVEHYNTTYNHVIDLSESRSYTFCVGWAQRRPYMDLPDLPFSADLPPDNVRDNVSNGIIYISNITQITTNTPSLPSEVISVNVYQWCGDDICFGNVTNRRIVNLGLYEQSGILAQAPSGPGDNEGSDSLPLCLNKSPENYNIKEFAMIHFGEDIVSARQIIKRYCLYASPVHTLAVGGGIFSYNIEIPDFPLMIGPQLAFPFEEPVSGQDFNYVRMVPLVWYSMAFMGYRGGVRYKANLNNNLLPGNTNLADWNVSRIKPSDTNTVRRFSSLYTQGAFASNVEKNTLQFMGNVAAGGVYHNPQFNRGLEYELPYQSPSRFKSAFRRERNLDFDQPFWNWDTWHRIQFSARIQGGTATEVQIPLFVAAADDMQFYFWKYTPNVIPRVYPTAV